MKFLYWILLMLIFGSVIGEAQTQNSPKYNYVLVVIAVRADSALSLPATSGRTVELYGRGLDGFGLRFPDGSTARIVDTKMWSDSMMNVATNNGYLVRDSDNVFVNAHIFWDNAKLTAERAFKITGSTSYLELPNLSEAQRDALDDADGKIIYNTDASRAEINIGGTWVGLGTGADSVRVAYKAYHGPDGSAFLGLGYDITKSIDYYLWIDPSGPVDTVRTGKRTRMQTYFGGGADSIDVVYRTKYMLGSQPFAVKLDSIVVTFLASGSEEAEAEFYYGDDVNATGTEITSGQTWTAGKHSVSITTTIPANKDVWCTFSNQANGTPKRWFIRMYGHEE